MSSTQGTYDQAIVDIKDYVFRREVNVPNAWVCARMALLDAIGCAIQTAAVSEDCRRLLGPTAPGTSVPDGFRLPGTSYQLDPVKGAFDMGALVRFLDHNDALGGAEWGHPSDNLGPILAVTDWLCRASASGRIKHTGPPLTVRTLLLAIIKAYEIQGCYQMRNSFNARGIDHVVLVKLASTAVVAWLLGATEEQGLAALSHVWMDGQPGRVYRSGANTIPRKGWAAADAGMRAVHLALLARAGQPGAPTVLSMPRWGFYTTSFGGSRFDLPRPFAAWVVQNIFFKVMPVEGHGISAVEAALVQGGRLRQRSATFDAAGQIARIDVRATAAAHLIINKQGLLHNAADRDHCIQYVIALALLKGDIPEVQDFQDASPWATSPELALLRARIDVREDEQLTRSYLDLDKKSVGAGLTVHLTDGTVLDEVLVEYPAGHMLNPRTASMVRDKFTANMGHMFSMSETEGVIAATQQDDMSVADFLDLLVRQTPTSFSSASKL